MSYQQGGQWGTPPERGPQTVQWGGPPRPPKKAKLVPILIGVGAFIVVMGIIGAVAGGNKTSSHAAPAATDLATPAAVTGSTTTSRAASEQPSTTAAEAKEVTVPVPRFVGMGLQSAQDVAQAEGFYDLISHDSSGRDRMQILDRDWKVCSQKPAAGEKVPADTELDFGAVKLAETCPGTDQKPPAKAGAVMPNFIGKGLNTATDALPSDTSIQSTDVSGEDRMILLESNWQVCSQTPAAGAPLHGQPVTFGAVKFGESCP